MLRRKLLISFIVFVCMPCMALGEYVPGEIFVKFKPDVVDVGGDAGVFQAGKSQIRSESIDQLNSKYKVQKIRSIMKKEKKIRKTRSGRIVEMPDLSQIYLLQLADNMDVMSAVYDYRRDPSVEFASPNYKRKIFTPNDWMYVSGEVDPTGNPNQWGLYKIWLTSLESGSSGWNRETGTSEVKVVIIDTGANYNHEDLKSRVDTAESYDFVNGDKDPIDDLGHGTHVAGIIGADTNNGKGVAGVDWYCRLIPLKAFDLNGEGSDDDIISALLWAIDTVEANVISMSFGGPDNNPAVEAAISYAATSDCVLVAAAGNYKSSTPAYPAAYDSVIAVAATNSNDRKADYSNYGGWVDVSAPGGEGSFFSFYSEILSTYPFNSSGPSNDAYRYLAGTSMAAPFVSGLAALILAKYPGISAESVAHLITDFADNIDAYNPGYEGQLGKGRINAYASLAGLYCYMSHPARGSTDYGIVEIKGNATGEGFISYKLEFGYGGNPTTWETITSETKTKLDSVLGLLDTTGKDSNITLRLMVNDLVTRETRVTFHAGSLNPPLIEGRKALFAYGPNPFDPKKESIMIKYDLNANSDVNIYFYDVTGNLICRKYYPYGTNGGNSGTNRVYWNGKNDFNETVANGAYLFRVVSEGRTIGKGKVIVLK